MVDYLTYEQFQELHISDITEDDFNSYLVFATEELNRVTRRFYQNNNIDDDPNEFRAGQFRLALGFQIAYMANAQIQGADGLAGQPVRVSQSIGRTSVTEEFVRTNRADGNAVSKPVNALSQDALNALSGTGLLNRALAVGNINADNGINVIISKSDDSDGNYVDFT